MTGPPDAGVAEATDTAGTMDDSAMSDEWEYEYDETETESFYITLDLTSLNGPIRPPRARKSAATTPNKTPHPNPSTDSPPPSPEEQSDDDDLQVPEQEMAPQDQIQIMELHTRNPIVSYQNHIFSCSWADMIGTELLFSHPEERSDLPLLRRNKDYDLISANRVKIIGKKGTLVASSLETTEPEPSSDQQTAEVQKPAAEGVSSSSSKQERKRPLTNQARFLQRLANAKRVRGENDTVRTVFNMKRSEEFESQLRGWSRTEEQMAEIERLNRRMMQGDPGAAEALEDMYESLEMGDEDDSMEWDDEDAGEEESHSPDAGDGDAMNIER